MKMKGMDELQRKLKRVQSNASAMSGTHTVTLDDLFTPGFMRKHSRFSSVDELFAAGGFSVGNATDLEAIKGPALNAWLKQETGFSTWDALLVEATEAYAARNLMAGL